MPAYSYRGRNGAGEMVHGSLEGATSNAVADFKMALKLNPDDKNADYMQQYINDFGP